LKPHYEKGLRFSCARCSGCCRRDPGFVFLSIADAETLAKRIGLDYSSFVAAYCRWIPAGGGVELLSLKERANYDCVLWGADGCSVYEDRPLQCRTYPFWDSVVESEESWESTARDCPGMGNGRLFGKEEIERFISLREADPVATRQG